MKWFFSRKKKENLSIDRLVVGLGNPGEKYSLTRHNIGWMVAAALCTKYKKEIIAGSNIYLQSVLNISSKNILVALPTTYMNNSGEAVSKICDKYNIPIENVLVIVDEYNFPVGKVHLRKGGGDGGHNGIGSIIDHIGSNEFLRLRCGIGKDFPAGGMVDYVLSGFSNDDIPERDAMIEKAIKSIETVINIGNARAMSEVNSGKLWESNKE